MSSEKIKKKSKSGKEVEILGETFEPGKPDKKDDWRGQFQSRQDKLRYLQTGERYWYAEEGYGSEKRKTPA